MRPTDEPHVQVDRLKRILCYQRLGAIAFWAGFLSLLSGMILIALRVTLGAWLMMLGWALIGLLMLHSYLIIPFLKCPRCGNRFFTPNGILGLFSRINVSNRRCVHCGLTDDSDLVVRKGRHGL